MQSFLKANLYSIAGVLIVLMVALGVFFFRYGVSSDASDVAYHIATAQSFIRDGGVTLWETWGSLPEGRPHLYPPVYHILISAILSLGLSPSSAEFFIVFFNIVGLLFIGWYGIRKLFDAQIAFWYVLSLSSSLLLLNSMSMTGPAFFVLNLSPFIILLIKKQKALMAGLLLLLLFYTHMIFPWLVAGALIVWSLCNKKYLKTTLCIVGAAIVFYSPWLVHILSNLEYLRYFDNRYADILRSGDRIFLADMFFLLAGVAYIVSALTQIKKQFFKSDAVYFAALAALSSPIAYFEFTRYSHGIGAWSLALLGAFLISSFLKMGFIEPYVRRIIIGVVVAVVILNPQLYLMKDNGGWYVNADIISRNMSRLLSGTLDTGKTHFNAETIALAEIIKENSAKDDIIYNFTFEYGSEKYQSHRAYILAQLFSSLSNRAMGNLRYPEVYWKKPIPLEFVHIALADSRDIENTSSHISPEDRDVLNKKFEVIARTENNFLVLKNKDPMTFDRPLPRTVVPISLAWIGLIVGFGAIISSVLMRSKSSSEM